MMNTPPRSTRRPSLPTSSPSSARLRRLAPSPVKIPPSPFPTPPRRALLDTITVAEGGPRRPSQSDSAESADAFEYDFVPLERTIVTSTTEECGATKKRSKRQGGFVMPSATEAPFEADCYYSRESIPVIFEFHGRLGELAERERERVGRSSGKRELQRQSTVAEAIDRGEEKKKDLSFQSPDVPESIRGNHNNLHLHPPPLIPTSLTDLNGGSSSIPHHSILTGAAAATQRVVLIDRNQAQYGHRANGTPTPTLPLKQRNEVSVEDRGTLTASSSLLSSCQSTALATRPSVSFLPSKSPKQPPTAPIMSELLARNDREISVAESFYTFGRPDRRPSAVSIEDEDGWSYSLSAYGGDDDDRQSFGGPGPNEAGPSRKQSADSAHSHSSSLLIPDFISFIPPPPSNDRPRDRIRVD